MPIIFGFAREIRTAPDGAHDPSDWDRIFPRLVHARYDAVSSFSIIIGNVQLIEGAGLEIKSELNESAVRRSMNVLRLLALEGLSDDVRVTCCNGRACERVAPARSG